MRGHALAAAQAPAEASNRRCQAAFAIRVCLAAATFAITASTSSPLDRPVPLAWMGGLCAARLRLPGMAMGGRARPALCTMVTRGSPEKGEVRNPWGRAGKPETRIIRQQEAEQVAELRAKAWSQALRRNGQGRKGKKGDGDVNAEGIDVSITEDIKDFHERSGTLLRECGGRMNSLTFTYKWEQRYGESLVTFLSRQRLTVAEMLKQSHAFWVVDMPGDHDGAGQMQIYVLNEKKLVKENTRETLGDQLSMHGDSEAIEEWRSRRLQGVSRLDSLFDDMEPRDSRLADVAAAAGVALVGMPEDEDGGVMNFENRFSRGVRDDDEEEVTRQVECIKLPADLSKHQKIGPLLDSLEPCLSGVDSRLGLRQMHLAWTCNCTCAKSSVLALEQLGKLRQQGKGRQVRRLEDQIKCFADVVQSGMPTLGCTEIASVLGVIQNRSGYDTLLLFVANRIVSGGIDLVKEAQTCTPKTVSLLVKCMTSSGQRDMLLFRQLSNLVQLIPHDRFTLGSLAAVMESFLEVNKDPGLMRFVGAVLQQLDLSQASPEDVAAMLSALSKAQLQDEVSFRRLSRAVLSLPDSAFAPPATGIILDAFARAKFRDVALFRKLSAVVLQQNPTAFASDDIMRVVTAAAAFGSDSNAKVLMNHMDTALLATAKNDLSPKHIGIIAASYAEVGGPSDPQVLQRLAAAAMTLEPWVLDIQAMAHIVKAYSTLHEWDAALFARMSTVLQQVDPAGFDLRSVATIVQAYAHKEVRDTALLGKLAMVLQHMESSTFASSEAVQEVSVILNAYARAQMQDLALVLSQTLTNHLKPYIGGVTAQAMLNIIRRGVRSTSRKDRYVGGVREALEISRLENEDKSHSHGLSNSLEDARIDDEHELGREQSERGAKRRNKHDEFADIHDDDIDLNGRPANGMGRALVPFSQDYKGSSSPPKKQRKRAAMPIPIGWS